ncbi:MAG: VOC family protein [Gemmatimonadota bacterium]|nr:VOC family protein [Gemmatimonadota bacterium]MDE3006170.1 VOC family protein [Gemmatimonadota bacterium]MDE3013907.1 VOC family protein [Gemmatimonadota bacterium]
MKSDNPNVKGIKHMAFGVKDAEKALEAYARFLHVPADTEITFFPKSKNKVALFYLGGIEYQLCESTDPEGRFAKWIEERGSEGLHHICYEVDNIDKALAHAQEQGATLRICQACQVVGSHPHPEGWVAFLDDEAGGIEIEFMQVYTPEQLKEFEDYQGI